MTARAIVSFCKGVVSTRMSPRVPRHVGSNGHFPDLTTPLQNVTINPIEGDKEFHLEIQPHLNAGLWPVYLAMEDRYEI